MAYFRRILLLLALAAMAGEAGHAQGLIAPLPRIQFTDSNGAPLNGGKMCTYAAGTTTPQATYSDAALSVANSNPIVFDSAGRFSSNVYLSAVSYKFTLLSCANGVCSDATCATGTQVWSADNVPGGYAASVIVAGTVATARLGSGSANNTTFLRGDQAWATPWTVITTTATGTQNDFAPATIVGNTQVRCNNASLLTITGFAAGYDGQLLELASVGAGQVDFAHQNTGSTTAADRLINFATSGNTSLAAGTGTATYRYDGTSARWRLISHEQGAWITPTFAGGNYTASGSMTWTVASGDVNLQRYRLSGRTVQVVFQLSTTTIGGTVNNALQIGNAAWGGFTSVTSNAGQSLSLRVADNSATTSATPGLIAVASTTINLFNSGVAATNWTLSTDNTTVIGTIAFEVQ